MSSRFVRISGTRVAAVGDAWVAFSPASGETMYLNDESAAILEILEDGPCDESAIYAALAADSGSSSADVASRLQGCWPRMIEAGLVREVSAVPHVSR